VAVEGDDNPTTEDFEDAIAKLLTIEDIDIIIPVSGEQAVHELVITHIAACVANQMERRAIFGTDGVDDPLTSTEAIAMASAYENERTMLLSPSSIQYFNALSNSIEELPSYYVAAALAGVAASYEAYIPLTMKQIYGFYGVNEYKSKAVKMNEMRNGLALFDVFHGVFRMLHGKTTDTSSIVTSEWSVSFAKDRMMQSLRDAFSTNIIGTPITADTPYMVKSMTIGVLERLKVNSYINDYGDVKVRQNTTDPTLIEVKYAYKPTYPLNYIYIQFSVDLESGILSAE
jgi:hypothetical protein